MSSEKPSEANDTDLDGLVHRQAIKYGQDLARVYKAEKAKREKLELANQALRAVFDAMPDGLMVLDDALTVRQTNPILDRWIEAAPASVLGKPLADVVPSEALTSALRRLAAGATAPTHVEFTVEQPVKRALLASIAPLRAGRSRGWIVVLHDQSEHKRLEYQKAEFINIAAHELRTPLGIMLGYLQLLEEECPEDATGEAYEMLSPIILAGNRLKNIVNELIEFAYLQRGELAAEEIGEFDVFSLIQAVVSDVAAHAGERQVTLQIDRGDSAPRMVADAGLLRTALRQLVLNGIRFNKVGGYVRITATHAGDEVTITVSDTGVGIPQSDLDTIFQSFFQVEDHRTRHAEGLGLGLGIARRATAQLGGQLSIESRLGQGTTVTLALPIEQPLPDDDLGTLKTRLEASQQQSLAYARDLQKLYRQLQQTNKQLEQVNQQLDEANRLKSDFLGIISHELRSPFVSIDFALQAFPRYGLDHLVAEQRELIEQLTSSFKAAYQMIDRLVAFAGLLSKQGRLNLGPVNMAHLIRENTALLAPLAERREIELKTQVTDDLHLPAGDRERISEAVWHLLHNALKFTPAGGQVIARSHKTDGRLIVEVQDTGVGISADQQASIWESFAQLSDPLKRGVEGLGLGLALVRYVAAAHGGDVGLQSEPGVGSTFSFWLPLSEPAPLDG